MEFATPRVSQLGTKSGYKNITNYLNHGDFVTEVAPEKWKFKRYGSDVTLSDKTKNIMKNTFKSATGKAYKGFGTDGKNSLVKAFVKYAGDSYKSYYTPRKIKGVNAAPVSFFQQGMAYILAGEVRGYAYALDIASSDPDALLVLGKMVVDGKVNDKFAHAHTQASYLSWLKVMYPQKKLSDVIEKEVLGEVLGVGNYNFTFTTGTGCNYVDHELVAVQNSIICTSSSNYISKTDERYKYKLNKGKSITIGNDESISIYGK